jgi:hypothetical protein
MDGLNTQLRVGEQFTKKKGSPAMRDGLAFGSISPFDPFRPFVVRIKSSEALARICPGMKEAGM